MIALTGKGGSVLNSMKIDVLIEVPSILTPRIQEVHMMVYHYLCEQI